MARAEWGASSRAREAAEALRGEGDHESLALHPEAVSRFEREAQAVARIEHEHVVDIVQLVRARDGRPCIVTEIAECRQVCRGLMAAHAAGLVHRDLEPSNLFLVKRDDGAPFAKILDFGVAKIARGADDGHHNEDCRSEGIP